MTGSWRAAVVSEASFAMMTRCSSRTSACFCVIPPYSLERFVRAGTDAEGRLVLADALVDASSEQPDIMIDCATLTGEWSDEADP